MTTEFSEMTSKYDLVSWLEAGCKPKEKWRIGTEHEKFPFYLKSNMAVPYEGEKGIRAVLDGLKCLSGWEGVYENDKIIGLVDNVEGGAISLEPGGQFELSGAPLRSIHETCREVNRHLSDLRTVADPLKIGFLGMGFTPKWARADIPQMPKGRYEIMTNYMPKVGNMGLDMMYRTSTVQVNLDFASEQDMIKKFRTSLALQPIATAIFANSPFKEGKPSGALSLRSKVWLDTDKDRTGMLDFVFEDGFGFERYVDYALNVPMYFIYKDGHYHDATGHLFTDFMAGKIAGFEQEAASDKHWSDHLTTLFPEVRIKRYMEMRGADGGPWRRLCALSAFWVGLLYDEDALEAAYDIMKDWTAEERNQLRQDVPIKALKAEIRGRQVLDIAKEVLNIAEQGLNSRAIMDYSGNSEAHFLNTLHEIMANGETAAEELLRRYNEEWKQDINRVFVDYAY